MSLQPRIALGAPLALVDAVEDAEEHIAARPEQAVETHAVLRSLDLARVGGADGGDGVGVEDSGGEEADAARAQLVLVDQRSLSRETRPGQRLRGEGALVAKIVDGEHAAGMG